MAKFQSLFGITRLTLSWIEKDENGNLIKDQTVRFIDGVTSRDLNIPATLHTEETELLKFLRENTANAKNGGTTFEEVEEPKAEPKKPSKKVEEALVVDPQTVTIAEAEPETESTEDSQEPSDEPAEVKIFDQITTNREAIAFLKTVDPTIKTADLMNKAKIIEKATSLNLSFPNL